MRAKLKQMRHSMHCRCVMAVVNSMLHIGLVAARRLLSRCPKEERICHCP